MEYKILNNDLSPDKLSSLSQKERTILCDELRDKIINTVASNGGHLASNLGIIELTVAILSAFDYKKDKIVFDVGHQSYAYKLLTGRLDDFDTLRQAGGISGFPRRSESPYDVFDTGHSSTSISATVGIARASELLGEEHYTIAVIGDGAMTGGMAYEALNDLGNSKTKVIVILNDNEMSINNNVGGLSKCLANIRLSNKYIAVKHKTEHFLIKNLPIISKPIVTLMIKVKDFLRYVVNRKQPSFFEDLGVNYYGPIDGHDIDSIINALNAVKDLDGPVLLHVCTKKGLGYKFAEENPSIYHGVGPFDVLEGAKASGESFTSNFSESIINIAKENARVVAICAAMSSGTGLDEFSKLFPKRFFDCGIAEEHAVTMAAGFAVEGIIPVVAIYSTFLQRAYDQILHDCCFMNNHVVFAIDRAGFVGRDGHTHNGLYDLAYLNTMPNICIFAPTTYSEVDLCLKYAINEMDCPCAIRYPRGKQELCESVFNSFADLSKALEMTSYGDDFVIISLGNMKGKAEKTIELLHDKKINGTHLNVINLKPLPIDDIFDKLKGQKHVFVVEEGVVSGGIGQQLAYELEEKNFRGRVHVLGIKSSIVKAATPDEQFHMSQMDSMSLSERIVFKIMQNDL